MSLIYCLVARGATVLAEWSESAGNFATVTRMLLAKLSIPLETDDNMRPARSASPPVSMVSYMYDGRHVFHCLEQRGSSASDQIIRFMVMADRAAGVKLPYRFLEELRRAFLAEYGDEMPQRVVALAYTDVFAPNMQSLMHTYNEHISNGVEDVTHVPPEMQRVRQQIDAIQNVMEQNIDRLMARGEKIDLLVDRAGSLSVNSYEFRRQAHQLQRMMWWRQKRLMLFLSGAAVALGTLLTSLEFGFPFAIFH